MSYVMSILERLSRIVDYGTTLGADFVEIRFQDLWTTGFRIMDRKASPLRPPFSWLCPGVHEMGAGIRILNEGLWVFKATTETSSEGLKKAIKETVKASKASSQKTRNAAIAPANTVCTEIPRKAEIDPREIPKQEKIESIKKLLKEAKSQFPEISHFTAKYADFTAEQIYVNSEGTELFKYPTFVYYFAGASLKNESSFADPILQKGWESFEREMRQSTFWVAQDVIASRDRKYGAVPDKWMTGLLAGEGLAHEARTIHERAEKTSSGQKVASELVTLIDDATLKEQTGSYTYDDEAVPGERTILVEKGIWKTNIHSRATGGQIGIMSTGNGRALRYDHLPWRRESNCYMAPGEWTLEEMIEDVNLGIYLISTPNCTGDGKMFLYNVSLARLIENGKFTKYVKNIKIEGPSNAVENIDAVGKEFSIFGICCSDFVGEGNQALFRGSGSPLVRIPKVRKQTSVKLDKRKGTIEGYKPQAIPNTLMLTRARW